ncbi:hypothetical protein L5G28_13840 [Gordonia sp. HY285]|uniref:hypothetical protein n=1 Tax=Gordonia liuliyuniae TaxID=2911517 RepID=UPI001F31FA5C|nr:hypothetical protein [Gordonia liuliyuniae]MCF8611228.1 hypothetical protein [Gordonia liuliyuniae]
MTTHIQSVQRPVPVVDLAGARWPLNKLAAAAVGFLLVVGVLMFGGSAVVAAWTAAIATIAVWWGGYAWYGRRWEHGAREYVVENRRAE